jgi:predicted PurR-regulated permease PerM
MKSMNKKQKQKSLRDKIRTVLVVYAKTQLFLTLIVTVVAWYILSSLDVQFSLFLAIMTGAASVIPILGMFTAGIITSFVAIFDSTRFLPAYPPLVEGIVVAGIYIGMNAIIDYFLSPYLIGRTSKINPLAMLFFVLIGSSIFGIWGALLTTPIILVIKAIVEYYNIE